MQAFFDFVKSLGAARMAAMAAVTLALIGFFSFLMIQMTTPHIVVRVGADIYETAKDKLEETACARGFEGRLVVMSDAAMAAGDCHIEWADGGVNRDQAATLSAIDDVVGRYVAASASA